MISEELAKIFGFPLRNGKWRQYEQSLNMKGEPTRANMTRLLFTLCEAVESLQSQGNVETVEMPIYEEANTIQPIIQPQLPSFTCEDCGKSYTAKIALLGHSKTHKKKDATLKN